MDLSKISKRELIEELNKRASVTSMSKGEPVLVVGTICDYPEGPMIELFNKVEKPEDLPSENYYLRVRINSHREYKRFYFKTDSYDALVERLNENPTSVSQWVMETDAIKKEYI